MDGWMDGWMEKVMDCTSKMVRQNEGFQAFQDCIPGRTLSHGVGVKVESSFNQSRYASTRRVSNSHWTGG